MKGERERERRWWKQLDGGKKDPQVDIAEAQLRYVLYKKIFSFFSCALCSGRKWMKIKAQKEVRNEKKIG